jgi:hypothetical protein
MPEEKKMERQYTQEEHQIFLQAVTAMEQNGYVDNEHNGRLIFGYFDSNPSVQVSLAAVYDFVERNKAQFQWLTPIELEYRKAATDNPQAAQIVSEWMRGQRQLVNFGQEGLQNQTTLIIELRGRSVTNETIQQAIGRALYSHKPIHRVPPPIQVDPRQHTGDSHFMSKDEVNLSQADRMRKANAATTAAEPAPVEPPDAHRMECEQMMRGGTHGFQAAAKSIADNGRVQGLSWREISRKIKELQKMYEGFRGGIY